MCHRLRAESILAHATYQDRSTMRGEAATHYWRLSPEEASSAARRTYRHGWASCPLRKPVAVGWSALAKRPALPAKGVPLVSLSCRFPQVESRVARGGDFAASFRVHTHTTQIRHEN